MIWLGIDPGMDGALAVIEGPVVKIFDAPTLTVGRKRQLDVGRACMLLACEADVSSHAEAHVTIEKVHSMSKQGVASSFNFGMGYGMWLGIIATLGIPMTMVTPQAWKKVMMSGMPKEKDASRARAGQLFPTLRPEVLELKKHHNRADALLIAEFGRRISRA